MQATTETTTARRHLPIADAAERQPAPHSVSASLPEFHHYRPRAGHPDWPELARRARALAAELRPRLEPPAPRWVDQRRKLKSYATAVRNFASNVKLARAGREDLRPLYFIWRG